MKKFFLIMVLALGILAAGRVLAASTPTQVPISGSIGGTDNLSVGIPGTPDVTKEGPVALIANLYDFALAIGGLLAFGSILYGAVVYLAEPGNHEAQSSAKARIKDAFLGLLLLVGIYMVLHIVNPGLTNLQFPTLQRLQMATSTLSVLNPNQKFSPTADVWACKNISDNKVDRCYATEKECNDNCDTKDTPDAGGGIATSATQTCGQAKGAVCPNVNMATGHLSCEYHQATGQLACNDAQGVPIISEIGYSGTGSSRNNPADQCKVGQGPIPQGAYIMSKGDDNAGHGPLVISLTPTPETQKLMCGRSGFLIHADNSTNDASQGCIIMGPDTRNKIINLGGGTLKVLR